MLRIRRREPGTPVSGRVARTLLYVVLAVTFAVATVLVVSREVRPTAAPGTHVLRLSLTTLSSVPPGGSGAVDFVVTNESEQTLQGVLVNPTLPPYVSVPPRPRCQRTGTSDRGGQLASCNFSDPAGVLAPGQTYRGRTTFSVDATAPAGTDLGPVEVTVVPLFDGQHTEDFADKTGPNTARSPIVTATGPGEG